VPDLQRLAADVALLKAKLGSADAPPAQRAGERAAMSPAFDAPGGAAAPGEVPARCAAGAAPHPGRAHDA
jgi:hypothetical protein